MGSGLSTWHLLGSRFLSWRGLIVTWIRCRAGKFIVVATCCIRWPWFLWT